MKTFFIILGLCMMCNAGGEAAFGLNWGMSPKEVRDKGVNLVQVEGDEIIMWYKADSLPKNHSMAEGYRLAFCKDSSLSKITMIGETIKEDIYGTDGKEKFEEILKQLSIKNKIIKRYSKIGNTVYDDADEFYQCLGYRGCGLWAALLASEGTDISIQLKGLKRGEGYMMVEFESKPEWSNCVDMKDNNQNKKDTDAF